MQHNQDRYSWLGGEETLHQRLWKGINCKQKEEEITERMLPGVSQVDD